MKKIFSFFAAMLVAVAVNAAVIQITPTSPHSSDNLRQALTAAASGDIIEMAEGTYVESNSDYLAFHGKDVTVRAADGAEVILKPQVSIRLKTGAMAEFIGIKFDCSEMGSYSQLIVPADDTEGKRVILKDCEFYGWTKNAAMIHSRSDRRLDVIDIDNCYFHDCDKSCIFIENANLVSLSITNSTFANITVTDPSSFWATPIYVKSTTGSVSVDHCTFYAANTMSTSYGTITVDAISDPIVSNCIFVLAESIDRCATNLKAGGEVKNTLTFNYANWQEYGHFNTATKTNLVWGDPKFADAANGDFTLAEDSPALTAAEDGGAAGDPRWIPVIAPAEPRTLYLKPNEDWKKDGARFAICILSEPQEWVDMTPVEGEDGIYSAVVTTKKQVIFCRMNGADAENLWGNKWNQTQDMTLQDDKDMCVINGWDNAGEWAKYEKSEPEPENPFETWFTGPENWDGETESKLVYDAVSGKATVTIAIDKNAQWKAQVKYHGISSVPDKFYHVGLKMKANHAISGVTLKWEDNTGLLLENASIALEENVEYAYNKPQFQSNAAGNGILVLDFGFAKAGDVIEIYDIVIEEVEAPVVDLEDGYYLIGLNGWNIYSVAAEHKFAETEVEGEYKLLVDLKNGDEFKVVSVAENTLGAWFPGEAGNYHVDLAHAGEGKPIFFRPNYNGGDDWHANCIFIPANEEPVNPIVETYFATTGDWVADTESSAVWDAENEKVTVTIALDKVAQWQAQVKFQSLPSQKDKFYHFSVKMKANHAMSGVTVKWDDNTAILENASIALEENVEFTYEVERVQSTLAGGNGIIVFDFGFAKAGDVIEIYDITVEEVEAPEITIEDGFYLIGLNGWSIYDLTAADKFVVNPDDEAEWILENVVLTKGQSFKVVSVAEKAIGTWYGSKDGNNYEVTDDVAGKKTIYFRPLYNEAWEGHIFVHLNDPSSLNNTDAAVKAVKVFENGQVVIIKNGVRYNVLGIQF